MKKNISIHAKEMKMARQVDDSLFEKLVEYVPNSETDEAVLLFQNFKFATYGIIRNKRLVTIFYRLLSQKHTCQSLRVNRIVNLNDLEKIKTTWEK